ADPGQLGRIAKLPGVAAVEPAPRRSPLVATAIDGSPTWHAAGCTGAGAGDVNCPSVDGAPGAADSEDKLGGPDVGVWDTGVNLVHQVFNGRSPQIVTAPKRAVANSSFNPCAEAPSEEFWCPYGSKHGNTIASIIASRDPAHLGMAPGVDKILDPLRAEAEAAWLSGFTLRGEPPAADLPEVVNYSAGGAITGGGDDDYSSRETDIFVSLFGIARSGAAGNSGPSSSHTLERDRVFAPCSAWNALCMGAMVPNGLGRADDAVAGYSSRGPTFGGRKKPDLLADGTDGCPSYQDSTTWVGNCGTGTSYAAPRGAAAIALLASAGVTDTSAQRAILINSSHMVPSEYDRFLPDDGPPANRAPARYWTPDGAWGELALDQTFPKRGNYALGTVTPGPGPNSARFYRVDGMAAGERTTLVWNRRVVAPYWPSTNGIAAFTTTDLDLYQYKTTGDTTGGEDNDDDLACAIPAQTTVSRCGVDEQERSERLGPFPANGNSDATDNVEQVRARTAGPSIIKVKASSGVTGAAEEPYALASDQRLIPIATPTISITKPVIAEPEITGGQRTTVSAVIVNDSVGTDLSTAMELGSLTARIELPPGVTMVGSGPIDGVQNNLLSPGERDTVVWKVQGNTSALHQISVSASGVRFGETFQTTSAPTQLTVDGQPPTASIAAPQDWYPARTAMLNWTAADDLADVAKVEVQASINGDEFANVFTGAGTSGSVSITLVEGQQVKTRIRATDTLGNTSDYVESTSWKVDADPPVLSIDAPGEVPYGAPAYVTIRSFNVGAPTTNYVRTNGSSVFQPNAGEVFLIPSVARLGLPVTVEAQTVDSLNRIVRRSVNIATRPRAVAIRVSAIKRGRSKMLAFKLSAKASGMISVAIKCGRDKLRKRADVTGTTAYVRVGKRSGRCQVAAALHPLAPYQFRAVKIRKRVRL
ncbi:MAG: S8 family serine peptidase, partial [Solirubrobacterales bacterium]